jgi:hypothetical protein
MEAESAILNEVLDLARTGDARNHATASRHLGAVKQYFAMRKDINRVLYGESKAIDLKPEEASS